jgi:uncharacterized membrane protein YdjX (TVP38/TMEM64 family)
MKRRTGTILAAAVALALLLYLGPRLGEPILEATERVQRAGPIAPLLFIALYVMATVGLVPGAALSLAGGAIFGVARGVPIVFTGATLGACAAFLLARHVARPAVERRLAGDPRYSRIDAAVGREGARIVLLLRLSPVVPFNLLNYALGITRVRFRDFAVASVGMLPGTLLYVVSGRALGELTVIAAGASPARGPASIAVLVLGLAATLAVVVVLTRLARTALREEVGIAPDDAAANGSGQAARSE